MTDVNAHVGRKIRHMRRFRQMSQTELGRVVGLSFQSCQKYETGLRRISAASLWKLSEALGVPVSYFFAGLETKGTTK